MKFFEFPQSELDYFSTPRLMEGSTLCCDVLRKTGVFILRELLPKDLACAYLKKYFQSLEDGSAKARENHGTEISFELHTPLGSILNEPLVIESASRVFQKGVGVHNIRIIRKDQIHAEQVFVHQDSPYCLGFFDRFSMFLALSTCDDQNGGLFVYPGTHNFGYLGDAGEIRRDLADRMYKFAPSLLPGDCLLMHSAIWHGSPPSRSDRPRVMYDIQIQPVEDPSSIVSLSDRPLSSWRLRLENREIFSNSRIQRASRGQS